MRYNHVSPRGRLESRAPIGERTLAAQRASIEALKARRGSELSKKANMAKVMGKSPRPSRRRWAACDDDITTGL